MRKIYCVIFITVTLCIGCVSAFASTSDSVDEATLATSLMQQFGSDYLPPFTESADEINLAEGSVDYNEIDLSLPGKNGFDLNVYRAYESNQNANGYEYMRDSYGYREPMEPMYRFTYGSDNSKEIYISFDTEEELVNSFYSTSAKLKTLEDDKNQLYARYSSALDDNGDILLTRDKTVSKKYVWEYVTEAFSGYCSNFDVSVGAGWRIHVPQLGYIDYSESNSGIRRTYYYMFRTETGEMLDIRYKLYRDNSSEPWGLDSDDGIYKVTYENYVETAYDTFQTHLLGFKYNIKIQSDEGKAYYFYLEDLSKPASVASSVVTDRYDNAIYYNYVVDEEFSSGTAKKSHYEIIDTMGRKVTVQGSGLTVTDFDGNQIKSVDYDLTTLFDDEDDRDPGDILDCINTHVLSVNKNQDSSSEKTEYYMKKKTICFRTGYQDYRDKIQKTVYPTNAYTEYVYEGTPTINKFGISASRTISSSYDYREYHIAYKNVYENNALKNSIKYYSVSAQWKYKNTTVEETMPNGEKKKSLHVYDQCGRLHSVESGFGTNMREDNRKTEYSYSDRYHASLGDPLNTTEAKAIRRAYVMNTREYADGNLVKSVDTKYRKKTIPVHMSQGEQSVDYTYDETYFVPLTIVTKKDADTTIKTENTLSDDKKSVVTSKIYENDVLKSTVDYTYNSDGTLAKTVEASDEYGSIITEYKYTYNSDSDCSYAVTTTVKNVTDALGNSNDVTNTKCYDSLGRLEWETDGNNQTTDYEYDKADRIVKQINPDGTYRTISYDVGQNSVTVTDENGNATTTDYTPLGLKEKVYLNNNTNDVAGTYSYDKRGRLLSVTAYTELGGSYVREKYTYDRLDRVKTQSLTGNSGTLDTVTYDYAYDETFTKYSQGDDIDVSGYDKVFVVVHSSSGSIPKPNDLEIKVDGETVYSDGFFASWCVGKVLDVSGKSTLKVTSNLSSNSVYVKGISGSDEVTLAGGEDMTVTATYNGDSTYVKPTEVKHIDSFGNVVSETYYEHGSATPLSKNKYKYDLSGNLVETLGGRTYMENLGDYTSKTEYDYMGNPTKSYRADGAYTTAVYNKQGQAVSTTDYMGNTATVKYDRLGRVIQTETPFEGNYTAKTLTFYDGNGNIIETREQNNNMGGRESYKVTEYEYDSRNRLITVKVNDGSRDIYTQYAYDNVGNMVKMVTGQTSKLTDLFGSMPDEATWQTYEYDRFGNVTKATDALGNSTVSEYNLMGLPTKQTDRNGNVTTNTYNPYGSLLTSHVTGGGADTVYDVSEDIVNTYNKNGMLISSAVGENNITAYTYDVYGNTASETTNGVTNTYTYDVNGNRKTYAQTENGASLISGTYTYDSLDRLTNVNFGGVSAAYTYDANNRLTREARGGVTSAYGYNKAGLVVSMENSAGESYTYEYKLDGNQCLKMAESMVASYDYDDLGQLKIEKIICREDYGIANKDYTGFFYTYDTHGNRVKMDQADNYEVSYITEYSYDKNNRLTEQKVIDPYTTNIYNIRSYEYDENGNLLFEGLEEYDWIFSEYETESVDFVDERDYGKNYIYNTRGQMTGVLTDSKNISYTYDPIGRRSSKTVNDQTTNHYWDGSDIVRETGANNAVYYKGINLIAQQMDGAVGYYLYNAHGDITGITGGKARSVGTFEYDAFGNGHPGNGAETPFRYNSQYYDEETGLYYLRNRYYDSSTGRFTQEDPAKDGLNWYIYCNNNPINLHDFWGLKAVPLREEAQRLGAVVTYDEVSRCAIVDFGYYGGYQFYSLNGYDDDGAFGQWAIINGEATIVAMVEEGRIEYDFGIVDNRYYWDEDNGQYVTVSLFDKGYDGYYQRIAVNGGSVTWESVNYSNFNTWYGGKYQLTAGTVYGSYVYSENAQFLKDLLAAMDAYPQEMPFSDYIGLASYFYSIFGYVPEDKLRSDDYQIIFHNRVYFLDRNMNYKYSTHE